MSLSDRGYVAEQYRSSDHFDARVRIYELFETRAERWPVWLFSRLGLASGERLLELGCGTGVLWRENAARIPAGASLTLADLSNGMLDTARARLAGLSPQPHFARADAQSLPFPDGRFDLVMANHMLYHVPDRGRALAELARVLAPGGLPGPLDRQRAQLPDEGAQPPPLCRRPCAAAERKAPPGRLPARVLHAGGGQRARQRLRAHGRAARDVPHAPAGAARQADRDHVPERSRSQVATAPVGRHRRGRRAQARVAFEP